MRGWRPSQAESAEITLKVNDQSATAKVDDGLFEIRVAFDQPLEMPFVVEMDCQPASKGPNDDRSLAFVLIEVRVEAP
jgi:hypothetical protein